jgi:hypothetical protein
MMWRIKLDERSHREDWKPSMENEACPHYEDIINNMMIGHAFLKE